MSFSVRTQGYSGPFDLLLQLVSRQRVAIGSISISEVADQYLAEVDRMGELDLDVASDFLLVASTLLDMKASSLVPSDYTARRVEPDEDDEYADLSPDEAREVLIERLIAYKQFRNAASALAGRMERESLMEPRTAGPDPEFLNLMPDYLEGISLRSLAVICADLDSRRDGFLLEAEHVAPRRLPIALTVATVDRLTRAKGHLTFTELLDVRKAMRELNIDGCVQIASGGQGRIYRIDDETIVKVFCNGGIIPLDYVQEELNNAKAAFVAGVPTAISFDTVKCGEYYGIIYEMINSKTLSKAVVDEPEKIEAFAERYAAFIKDFQSIHVPDGKFKQSRDIYNQKIEALRTYITEDELAVMHEIADSIPVTDTLIHGDPHSGNIMIKDNELMFIDMTEVCYGPKFLDNGAIFRDLVSASQTTPEACEQSMGLPAPLAAKLGEYLKTAGLACAFNIGANIGAYAVTNEMAKQKLPGVVERIIRGVIIPNKDALKYLLSAQ